MAQKGYSERQLRVSENIKRSISSAFNIDRVLSSIIGDMHITVSEVRMSPDLKNARVYILPDCSQVEKDEVIKIINEFSYMIKKSLGKCANLRFMPNLHFVFDDLFDKAGNIESLISSLDDGGEEND